MRPSDRRRSPLRNRDPGSPRFGCRRADRSSSATSDRPHEPGRAPSGSWRRPGRPDRADPRSNRPRTDRSRTSVVGPVAADLRAPEVTEHEGLGPGQPDAARPRAGAPSSEEGQADEADRSGQRHGHAPPERDIKHDCSGAPVEAGTLGQHGKRSVKRLFDRSAPPFSATAPCTIHPGAPHSGTRTGQ